MIKAQVTVIVTRAQTGQLQLQAQLGAPGESRGSIRTRDSV